MGAMKRISQDLVWPGKKKPVGPLRVAHIVISLDCGGVERLVLDLVRQGQTLGQKLSIICLVQAGDFAGQARRHGIAVYTLNKGPGIRLGLVPRLGRLLHTLGVNVIHTHEIGALFYTGPAAGVGERPIILHTEHGKNYPFGSRKCWLGWLAAHWAGRICCVSADVAADLVFLGIARRQKIVLVPNGIDTSRFALPRGAGEIRPRLGIQPNAFVIGTVGRLDEIKCQDLLLLAFARLHERIAQARLLLVGEGPQRQVLEQLAVRLGIGREVFFAGYQEQPERYLASMDVFALTSRSEGLPLAILEAWAAGLPVVASSVGGLPELIAHGQTGILFPSGQAGALASALEKIWTDPDLARRLAEAGRRLVRDRYDVSVMARAYQDHYLDLLAKRRP
jgi:glycosyltransferase involved in cell wall biosynthesis